MEQDYSIVRCPKCGSTHLTAVYNDSEDKKIVKRSVAFGLLGLLYSIFKKNESAYWICDDCNHAFRMD